MKRILHVFAIFSFILFSSCLEGFKKEPEKLSLTSDFQEIKVLDQYSLSVPKYMKSTTILHDDASLQYMHALKETYVVVIDEDKSEMIEALKIVSSYDEEESVIDNYAKFQSESIMQGLKVSDRSEIKKVVVNGTSARVFELSGQLEDVPYEIKYILGFTEGEEDVYMIMSWTLDSRSERYSGTLRQIIKSFKEI
ncbi:hypothetical protein ABN763_09895 [Spongiivirga sp. MCCC 1A20706]|uniref:hypothetical protein n=1 Tax=Spongiivirga sp. MCCC 1A20706 TaxID=3160963 RepID=UPI003977BC02